MNTQKQTAHRRHDSTSTETAAPAPQKNRIDSLLNLLIIAGILVVVGLAAVMMGPSIKTALFKPAATPAPQAAVNTATVDDISVKSELSEDILKTVIVYVKQALKQDFVPTEMTFQSIDKGDENRGPSYVANWNKNGKFISLLVGNTKENKLAYTRIWIMPPGTSVNQAQAQSMLADLFAPEYLKNFPAAVPCQAATNPLDQKQLTECAAMKTMTSGDLYGVTVRAPITLQPPPGAPMPSGVANPEVVVVSACAVPKEGTSFYPGSTCQ